MTAARPGTVYLVGAGPGDPDLITVRGAELLASADVVLHDELVHRALLRRVSPHATIEYAGKRGIAPDEKQTSQAAIDARLVELARAGKSVVRLKGGDPFLFGRGSEEALALSAAGLAFEVVPGVTSPIAAAAYAGISLTHRDLASSVVFLSGTKRDKNEFDFSELAGHTGTVVILMGLRRLRTLAAGLIEKGKRSPDTAAAVIARGTLPDQRVVVGTLADIADRVEQAALATPALVVVGEVVSLRSELNWFEALPLFGRRVLVPRTEQQASETAHALARRGAQAIEIPLIRLEDPDDRGPLEAALGQLGTYDLVLFTSENTVARLWAAMAARGLDARAFRAARIAAVGDGTAAALARVGLTADLVPPKFRGEALAEVVLADLERTAGGAAGARILLPRALVAREVLPELLRDKGAFVDVVPVYETHPARAPDRAEIVRLLAASQLDAILLLSASMVDALVAALGEDAGKLLAGTTLASIGPITTRAAEAHGLKVAVNANSSTIGELVGALERHFAKVAR